MDAEEFAARRRARFVRADDDIRPTVKRVLSEFAAGDASWANELIEDASVLWLEIFTEESPHADPDRFMERFQNSLREALAKTTLPDDPPAEAQIERVTMWVGTYTVNDATYQAAGARGVRYKRWVTMHDNAVRDTHVVADGQVVRIGAPFDVGGYDLRFPGDPVGPPEIWINCRCVMQSGTLRGELAMTPTSFAVEVDEVVDVDEDLPVDELEDDEEEVTEIPVHGVLAPEGVPTGDGRQFADGALSNRNLPLPIAYQLMSAEGHMNSVTVGRIDEIFRVGNEMRFRGMLVMTKEHTPAVIEGIIDGTVRGVSVDVDDVELEMSDEDLEETEFPGKLPVTVFSHARIAGVTIVPIPAFQEAFIGLGHEFADEMSEEALAACAVCVDPDEDEDENQDIVVGYDVYDATVDELANWAAAAQAEDGNFRNYTAEERRDMAKNGQALPDGSFPIKDEEDLRNAIQAIGRASDPAAAKAHIKKRARALGHSELIPEGWAQKTDDDINARIERSRISGQFAPGTKDGPGWITHPIPTSRIRRYWVKGKGAAKIRWGVPGDFNRCRRQLAKYITNPDWLAGACANMHKEALGVWPGRPLSAEAVVASGAPAPIFTLVASASPHRVFEANAFGRMEMEDPRVGLVMEGDRVYGYVAQWGVCHIGIDGLCTTAPQSQTDYWYYATGVVDTEEGPVHVGQITMDTGHANLKSNAKVAAAHYDNTGAAVADIAVGEDAFGIWFSGLMRPTATEDQRHALKASGRLSGDWRYIGGNLELVAALAVNVPGFPIPHVMVASANGVQTALVAAGVIPPVAPAVTASVTIGADPEMIAAIARTAVAEYRHMEKREAKTAPLRETLRQRRIETLRTKIKE